MCCVLARGLRAVMAADTVSENVHVIEIRGHPAGGYVTVIASVAADNVSLVLTGCTNAVVAANAVSKNTTVIEDSR